MSSEPRAAFTGALLSSLFWMTTADGGPLSIALPGTRAFPESITSTSDGTLFIGRLGEGGVVRANPRTGAVALFVAPGASGSWSITGVFADDASGILWACSNDLSVLGGPSGGGDHVSALKGFDLRTGAAQRSVPLPEPNAFCNDIAVDAIRDGFRAPTSVTRVGSTAWVSEGQLSFFFDRARKGESPSLPFRIYAVPLNAKRAR
jgi:hypothetical protein